MVTLVLTVLVDLTVAIGVGVALGLAIRLQQGRNWPARWHRPRAMWVRDAGNPEHSGQTPPAEATTRETPILPVDSAGAGD